MSAVSVRQTTTSKDKTEKKRHASNPDPCQQSAIDRQQPAKTRQKKETSVNTKVMSAGIDRQTTTCKDKTEQRHTRPTPESCQRSALDRQQPAKTRQKKETRVQPRAMSAVSDRQTTASKDKTEQRDTRPTQSHVSGQR